MTHTGQATHENHKETIMCTVSVSLRLTWLYRISLQILLMIQLKGQRREVIGARLWVTNGPEAPS